MVKVNISNIKLYYNTLHSCIGMEVSTEVLEINIINRENMDSFSQLIHTIKLKT